MYIYIYSMYLRNVLSEEKLISTASMVCNILSSNTSKDQRSKHKSVSVLSSNCTVRKRVKRVISRLAVSRLTVESFVNL